MNATVINIAFPSQRVDLHDGRVLEPGGKAENVDLSQPHNEAQAIAGRIAEVLDVEPDDETPQIEAPKAKAKPKTEEH